MPHTSSRRRQHASLPHPTKLTTAASSDGWSHVVRKGSSNSAAPRAYPKGAASSSNAELAELLTLSQLEYYHKRKCAGGHGHGHGHDARSEMLPKPMEPRCSGQELGERFGKVRRLWNGSGVGGRVRGVLERAGLVGEECVLELVGDEVVALQQEEEEEEQEKQDDGDDAAIVDGVDKLKLGAQEQGNHTAPAAKRTTRKGRIDKAICLGLGSPSADASGWRQTVLWQLAAFLEIVDALLTHSPHLHVYVQDPIFNSQDIAFLASLEIHVLPSPEAFTLITPTTLVYAPHYPVAGWPSTMRRGNAACIIGNDVEAALAGGRILAKGEIERLFADSSAEFSSQGAAADTAKSDADPSEHDGVIGEIPDLHARDELQAFVGRHASERWPGWGGGLAEGAFNDTFAYWRKSEM